MYNPQATSDFPHSPLEKHMSQVMTATAQVANQIPAFIKNVIRRTTSAWKRYEKTCPQNAVVGQVWALDLPIPLWDTINPQHSLGPVRPMLFITDIGKGDDEFFPDGNLYGFLCLGTSVIDPFPVLERELKQWEHAPYMRWVDATISQDREPSHRAEFIVPMFPVYIRREWLSQCEGDLGEQASRRVREKFVKWFRSEGPDLDCDHPRNKIGGHPIGDVMEHIKSCWSAH